METRQKIMDKQLNIELGPEEAEGIYSNLVLISHSPAEFVLDFTRILPGKHPFCYAEKQPVFFYRFRYPKYIHIHPSRLLQASCHQHLYPLKILPVFHRGILLSVRNLLFPHSRQLLYRQGPRWRGISRQG